MSDDNFDDDEPSNHLKELDFGQTPWDDWPRERLLREVQRMYSAVNSLYIQVLNVAEQAGANSVYYTQGVGGAALAKGAAIVDPIEREYDAESLYKRFYRAADGLLFPEIDHPWIDRKWAICPKGDMTDGRRMRDESTEYRSTCPECNEPLRPIEWSDLTPKIKKP